MSDARGRLPMGDRPRFFHCFKDMSRPGLPRAAPDPPHGRALHAHPGPGAALRARMSPRKRKKASDAQTRSLHILTPSLNFGLQRKPRSVCSGLAASAAGFRPCDLSPQTGSDIGLPLCPNRPTRWLFHRLRLRGPRTPSISASVPWLSTQALVRCNLSQPPLSPGRPPRPAPGVATPCVKFRLTRPRESFKKKTSPCGKVSGDKSLERFVDLLWRWFRFSFGASTLPPSREGAGMRRIKHDLQLPILT